MDGAALLPCVHVSQETLAMLLVVFEEVADGSGVARGAGEDDEEARTERPQARSGNGYTGTGFNAVCQDIHC